jgi:hypothetical protein
MNSQLELPAEGGALGRTIRRSLQRKRPLAQLAQLARRAGAHGSLLCLLLGLQWASGADFAVTSPGFFFSFNGTGNNPMLTVVRGETYTFAVTTASFHPFKINSTGTSANNISSGTITWTVPLAASNYTYQCGVHGFGNSIITVPPPTVRITDFAVGNKLTLRSTGASNYSVLPEYKTNLSTTNWFALTVQTNRFANGTNETICGRPPDSNVFIRIKAQRN